ncbi:MULTISPECIES: ABC transporter ATP-binding protein [unclassified Yoonia]|uniref:ABC transporter ATP-binding protein n=1 Tax=unclassified Yoonia TaxID=2629118 RepID=UPI002AFE0DDD|nr:MULTISPECIES: ABC transporter ATP-binding protein [unclassified Yoonia]
MITLDNLGKTFGTAMAVQDVSLSVPEGAFLVLLGPSGCGKTTILRMLAGLEHPTAGVIRFDDKIIADAARGFTLEPGRRDAGLVFQSYALWPHMSVAGNVAWPLRVAGLSRDEQRARVAEALEMLGVAGLAARYPGEISGGQQQRVAIARMIAPRPKVLLFDEPLSNLDATLRVEMRTELLRVHRATKATAVYVTHDQIEAMTMATHVAVLNGGRVEQFDTPERLLSDPASAFVARFIGTPPANLIPVQDGAWFGTLPCPALPGANGHGMVRAEDLMMADAPGPDAVAAQLVEVVPMAGRRLVTGMVQGQRLTAVTDAAHPIPADLHFRLPPTPSAVFDAEGRRLS